MKRYLFAIAALTIGHAAFACDCNIPADRAANPVLCGITGNTNVQNQGQTQVQRTTDSSASNSNATGGSVGPVSAASTAAIGNTSSTSSASGSGQADASNAGNTQTTVYAAARIPVAPALAGFQQTTAGCRFAEGLGIQLTSAGTSVGFTFKDRDCVRFELAQFFYSRGQDIAADRIVCAVKEVKATLGDDCLALVHQVTATRPTDAVTHEELATFGRSVSKQIGVQK